MSPPQGANADVASAPLTNGTDTSTSKLQFDSVEDTIEAFSHNQFILLLDSPDRENEGDLIISAEAVTPGQMSFLVHHSSGLICCPLPSTLADHLDLPPMIPPSANQDPNRTAYTITVDAEHPDTSTGISAHDRALTCRTLAAAGGAGQSVGGDVGPSLLRRPGHILPLRAKAGGVRERRGHTEAAVEMCRLAGKGSGVAVIAEVVEPGEEVFSDGKGAVGVAERKGGDGMMRRDGLLRFAKRWGIRICTIEALVEWLELKEGKI